MRLFAVLLVQNTRHGWCAQEAAADRRPRGRGQGRGWCEAPACAKWWQLRAGKDRQRSRRFGLQQLVQFLPRYRRRWRRPCKRARRWCRHRWSNCSRQNARGTTGWRSTAFGSTSTPRTCKCYRTCRRCRALASVCVSRSEASRKAACATMWPRGETICGRPSTRRLRSSNHTPE